MAKIWERFVELATIKQVQTEIGDWAREKGFVEPEVNIDQKLMLIVDELAEAHEEIRTLKMTAQTIYYRQEDGKPEGFGIELADALIRILQLADSLNLDMQKLVAIKMAFNETRPYKHGKRF